MVTQQMINLSTGKCLDVAMWVGLNCIKKNVFKHFISKKIINHHLSLQQVSLFM